MLDRDHDQHSVGAQPAPITVPMALQASAQGQAENDHEQSIIAALTNHICEMLNSILDGLPELKGL